MLGDKTLCLLRPCLYIKYLAVSIFGTFDHNAMCPILFLFLLFASFQGFSTFCVCTPVTGSTKFNMWFTVRCWKPIAWIPNTWPNIRHDCWTRQNRSLNDGKQGLSTFCPVWNTWNIPLFPDTHLCGIDTFLDICFYGKTDHFNCTFGHQLLRGLQEDQQRTLHA